MWCWLIVSFFNLLPNTPEDTDWGFFPHRMINKHAVYTLPPTMLPFYLQHQQKISALAIQADRRRYASDVEGPRHYIDLDVYGLTVAETWTRYRDYGDSLGTTHGVLPWHLMRLKNALTEAFRSCDRDGIIRYSADIGHYLADAHVPLHTTSNYNGQQTNQKGIHAFWETRIPERLWGEFDLWAPRAVYWQDVSCELWDILWQSHHAVDSVLYWEKHLTLSLPVHKKYSYRTRNGQIIKDYSMWFLRAYNRKLNLQVERQLRRSIHAVGSFWYTCWLDAGQPQMLWEMDLIELPELDQAWKQDQKK